MPRTHKPRAGSLQFWPRSRSKTHYANVKAWAKKDKVLAFAGYKAGITHVQENNPKSKVAKIVSVPVTIIECPPLKPLSIRFYKKTPYGAQLLSEISSKKLNKELSKKIRLPKAEKEQKVPESYDYIKLAVYTQPKLTNLLYPFNLRYLTFQSRFDAGFKRHLTHRAMTAGPHKPYLYYAVRRYLY